MYEKDYCYYNLRSFDNRLIGPDLPSFERRRNCWYSVEDVHRLDHNSESGYIEGIVINVLGFEVYNSIE